VVPRITHDEAIRTTVRATLLLSENDVLLMLLLPIQVEMRYTRLLNGTNINRGSRRLRNLTLRATLLLQSGRLLPRGLTA